MDTMLIVDCSEHEVDEMVKALKERNHEVTVVIRGEDPDNERHIKNFETTLGRYLYGDRLFNLVIDVYSEEFMDICRKHIRVADYMQYRNIVCT